MRQELRWLIWAGLAVCCLAVPAVHAQDATLELPAPAAEQPARPEGDAGKSAFLRVRYDESKQPIALETAIARYQNPEGTVRVDLVGAVHIGDGKYYDDLNKLFSTYQVVLYELVAPEGTRIPKGGVGAGGSPVSGLQRMMKNALGLEFQLERVDYTPKNLVHADMSPEEFAQSMEDRGESVAQLLFRALGQSAAVQSRPGSQLDAMSLWTAALRGDKTQMKSALAKQFEDIEGMMNAINGPEGSTIVNERNRKAMDVLQRELSKGNNHVAIFYGAGHLPDMDQRLREDFGLKPTNTSWLTAWRLE